MLRRRVLRWFFIGIALVLIALSAGACSPPHTSQVLALPTEMLLPTLPPQSATFTLEPTLVEIERPTLPATWTPPPSASAPTSVPTLAYTVTPLPSFTPTAALTATSLPTATFTLTPIPQGDASVTGDDGANLRTGPSRNFEPPVTLLPKGTELLLAGRSADSQWLDVRTLDGLAGWVFADLVTPRRDLVSLPVRVTSSATVMATGNTVRFAVVGDFGNDSPQEGEIANLVSSWNPEFIISTGDTNYPDGEAATIDANVGKYYHSYIGGYSGVYGPGSPSNRFFPTLGNHDWHTPGALPYLNYFTLPDNERYYDFIWGPVHFFAVDSDEHEPDGISPNSIQGQWLQRELAASPSRLQIVYMHHPPYSSGDLYGSSTWMQWPYRQWGADVVMGGHEHSYERLIVDNTLYFVNGLGGARQYGVGDTIPGSVLDYNDDHGAMLVTVSETTVNFKFITRTGVMIDDYTMNLP